MHTHAIIHTQERIPLVSTWDCVVEGRQLEMKQKSSTCTCTSTLDSSTLASNAKKNPHIQHDFTFQGFQSSRHGKSDKSS